MSSSASSSRASTPCTVIERPLTQRAESTSTLNTIATVIPTIHNRRFHAPRPSIIDVAETSGLMDLSPSDLVHETGSMGISYYDYCISASYTGATPSKEGCTLHLAKFDPATNLETLDSTHVSAKIFEEYSLPETDYALAILGMLTYKKEIARSKVLLLLRKTDHPDSLSSLDVIKRVAGKFKISHHVQQLIRASDLMPSRSSFRPREGMRMRVMCCQTRQSSDAPPTNAVRETKALLEPRSNPILCICFSITP